MVDALNHTVVLLSVLGIAILVPIVSYIFNRRSSLSKQEFAQKQASPATEIKINKIESLSQTVVVFVSVMAAVVGGFSAVQAWYAKKESDAARRHLTVGAGTQNAGFGIGEQNSGKPSTRPDQSYSFPLQKLCSEDPVSGEPYARVVRFAPKEFLEGSRTGIDVSAHSRDSGQLQEWTYTVEMPGPVTVVTANPVGALVTIDSCDTTGSRVICRGKLSGNTATPIILNIRWQQPCEGKSP